MMFDRRTCKRISQRRDYLSGGVSFQEYKSHSVCCAVLLFSTVARGSSSFEHEFKYLLKFGKLGWVRGFSVGVEL